MAGPGTAIQVLGIDPGRHGAMVHIGSAGDPIRVFPMPVRDGDQIDFERLEQILRALASFAKFEAAIEKQQPFGRTAGASKVMMNYGIYLECLRRAGMPFTEYHQSTWKSKYKLLRRPKKGDKSQTSFVVASEGANFTQRNAENKAASLRLANIYYPRAAGLFGPLWTPDAAEACLIGSLHRQAIIEREQLARTT